MLAPTRSWPAGAAVPDLDSLQADACGPTYTYDSNTRLKLEAKDHMRARGVKSPDEWDAVALTFAEPVAPDAGFRAGWSIPPRASRRASTHKLVGFTGVRLSTNSGAKAESWHRRFGPLAAVRRIAAFPSLSGR
jgi:hypothetical protein